MTVYVRVDRVVVDGPLPGGEREWRRALERELAAALAATPAGAAAGWPAAGQDIAELAPATPVGRAAVRPGTPITPTSVAAAVGAALATGGRR